MTVACPGPDATLGVALRLSTYVDCQARALGENGFQAFAGGPVAAGLLSGLVTIFVALIGYRLILGQTPDIRDGVGWVVRLGVVLALVTSWPAFQTLIYRVAVDGPGELAGVLLPAAGLPNQDVDIRIQQAYDTIRLGSTPEQLASSQQAPPGTPGVDQRGQAQAGNQQTQLAPSPTPSDPGQPPSPQTASTFLISTSGAMAALRIAVGFLLAVGPLGVMGLLFDATLGLFSGWIRALAGATLALLAATVITAIDLVMVEGELAHLQTYMQGSITETVDQQALTTIVFLFAVAMLVTVLFAARMASAFRLRTPLTVQLRTGEQSTRPGSAPSSSLLQAASAPGTRPVLVVRQARTAAITDALTATIRRERSLTATGANTGIPEAPSRRISIVEAASRSEAGATGARLGVAGRRSIGRRTRSAASRDRTA